MGCRAGRNPYRWCEYQANSNSRVDGYRIVCLSRHFLVYDTLYENIAIGSPSAGKEAVIAAAEAAQCHDFIERLPDGYDTKIGDKGIFLSGGEAQRICVARAILKNAPILVLDEATAFADPENEYKMQMALQSLIKDKTVIVIAHRLSSIVSAHQIVVMKEGRIVQCGKHNILSVKEGYIKVCGMLIETLTIGR